MRVGKDNLAGDIVNTISKVENLIGDWKNIDGVATVGYDGKNLVVKRSGVGMRDSAITTKEELLQFEKYFYENNELYESSFNNDYISEENIKQTQLFYNGLKTKTLVTASEKIKLVRDDEKSFLVMTTDGKIALIGKSDEKLIYGCDIVKDISNTFNISTFTIYDIVDVELAESKIFIATDLYGIFQIDMLSKTIELKFKELNTVKLKYIGDGSILCLTKEYIALYNDEYEERIERLNILKNNYQIPKDIYVNGDDIFILAKSLSGTTNDRILYYLKKSGPTILHNMTRMIPNNDGNLEYIVKFISGEKNNIYLIGTHKNKIFVWIYDIVGNEIEERIFDICLKDIDFFNVENGVFMFGFKNRVMFTTDDGVLLGNKYCDLDINSIIVGENSRYLVSDKYISTFDIESSDKKTTRLKLVENEIISDLSMLIKNYKKTDGLKVFINGKQSKDFIHAYCDMGLYIKFNGIINDLEIEMTPQSIIPGVILKKNEVVL